MQKTTLKEGAGTKIIIWQYHPLPPCSSCLVRQEEDGQQGGQSSSASLSSPVASAAGVSSRLALSAGISHSGRVPLHNTSPSWAPSPHLTLNKHPLHYPGLHKTEKVRYIQASLGLTLPSQSRSSGHQLPQQVRLRPRGPRERRGCRGQPRRRSPFPSPPGGGGTCRQGGRSPFKRLGSTTLLWQKRGGCPGAAGGGKGEEPGAVFAQSSLSSFSLSRPCA